MFLSVSVNEMIRARVFIQAAENDGAFNARGL
jgi:hypothetical protein